MRSDRPVRRDINEAEDGYRLRLAVLQHLEVRLRQISHEVPLPVSDNRIDLDVVDAGPECLLSRRLGIRHSPGNNRSEHGDSNDSHVRPPPRLDHVTDADLLDDGVNTNVQ